MATQRTTASGSADTFFELGDQPLAGQFQPL